MDPLAVSLPCPYRIVSVCRSAAAKSTRGSPTLCTRLERAGDQRAPLLTEPPLVHRHRRESPALLWAGRGHVPTPARSLSVHFVQRGSVSNGTLVSPARSSLVHRAGDPRVFLAAAERHTLTMRYGREQVPTPGTIGRR